jgi:zinc protease
MTLSVKKRGQTPAPKLDVIRTELSCGAKLFVSPRPGAPVTAAQVHMRGGHSLDTPELGGVAWLAGRLVDQGTRHQTADELALELDPFGGSVQGDSSGVSGQIVSAEWRLLLKRMAAAVTEPAYPKARVELQRGRVLDRLELEADDPRSQAMLSFRKLVYGEHWLGQPHYGTLDSVARIERKHIVAFHKKNWLAARAVISVCGDVDPAAVHRLLERELKGWRTGKRLGDPDQSFPERGQRTAAFKASRKQVHLYLGHLGCRINDPDYPALVVMDHVLGTGPGFTNRISRRLRDEEGLAYTVNAAIHNSAGNLPGTFTAYIGTSPEHTGRAVKGFVEEMRRMQDEPVGAAELDVAKSYLTGSFGLGFERSGRRAGFLVSQYRFGLPDDHLTSLPARFAAVTAADVQAAAQRHLFPDACCLSAGGPLSQRDLKKALAEAVG